MTEFAGIYNKTKGKLFNYVLKMTGKREMSEDIIQTVYLKLYENIKNRNEINNVEAWLFITARNEIYGIFRKKKIRGTYNDNRDMDEFEVDSGYDLSGQIEMEDFKTHLDKELSEVNEEQREVFLLKEYGGFSYKEISQILNINLELVKSRLFKVRQKLIKKLAKIVN